MLSSTKIKKISCAITMGDPSGIGPEVILKSLAVEAVRGLADFLIIGDRWVLNKIQKSILRLRSGLMVSEVEPSKFKNQNFRLLDLANVPKRNFRFGRLSPEYGRASIEYLKRALELLKGGSIDCLVTAPINKKAIRLAGYAFPGHSEYIAEFFSIKNIAMMLFNQKLRVALVTRHIPLKDVANSLTAEKILRVIEITSCGLKSYFGLRKPRLAVCALNPHSSDSGLLGNEERRFIIPAIQRAKQNKIIAHGPYASDTLFPKAIAGHYDAVICMYHDQGLIPIKLSGFNEAVNITLGLPFVRTSPGHGTALDIAGKAKASPQPFIEAIKAAVQCAQNLKKDLARSF